MPEANSEEVEDRFLIEISDWDWGLHVAMAPEILPQEQRFQGGLLYSRSLDIVGAVLSPELHSGKVMRLSFLPFGSDVQFGPDGLQELGQLYEVDRGASGAHFTATLILPQDTLPACMTALASAWKYLHLWTEGEPAVRAAVTGFTFSRRASASP
jgi:hypothetical protein